jgi:hypothetical protein
MSDNVEDQFHRAMIAVYQNALRDCTQRAAYILQMVGSQGGVETARNLLQSDDVERGPAALWECGRLDLMFEYLILQPTYAELFTDEEKKIARERLKKYGYSL